MEDDGRIGVLGVLVFDGPVLVVERPEGAEGSDPTTALDPSSFPIPINRFHRYCTLMNIGDNAHQHRGVIRGIMVQGCECEDEGPSVVNSPGEGAQ